VLTRGVGRDVPEAVDHEDGRGDLRAADDGLRHVDANEVGGIDRGAERVDLDPGREVRRSRRAWMRFRWLCAAIATARLAASWPMTNRSNRS